MPGGVPARDIAYYESAQGPGVFAPVGWHCREIYGSGGGSLLVTPTPLDSLPCCDVPKLHGPAIELDEYIGGTSGRFPVAEYASRLFPREAAAFIKKVRDEGLEPDSDFERGPYRGDSVRYVDPRTVEYTTPGNATGLGTTGDLAPSPEAIRGWAALSGDSAWPHFVIVQIRLGADVSQLEDALMRMNHDCVR